jgi:hypothetical protein
MTEPYKGMSLLDLLVFLSGCAFPGFCQWPRRILFHSSYESWTVREHQNQKYAYGHGALILLILLAGSYR